MAHASHAPLSALLRVLSATVLALSLVGTAAAELALQPHTAEYKVKIRVLGGQLKTELRATDSGYVATHVVKATGMSRLFASGEIRDSSEFDAVTDGVRPSRFRTKDTVTRDKTDATIAFDWEAAELRGLINGQEIVLPIEQLAHDRISIQYELMLDLLSGSPSAEYTLYDGDELKTLTIRNIGSRRVKVPVGEFTAIGIQHQSKNSRRITTLWCVEELGYLPVIIEQHSRGKLRMRATLRRYEPIRS